MAGRTRGSSNSPTGHGGSLRGENNEDELMEEFKYESLLGNSPPGEGEKQEGSTMAAEALSSRLLTFRDWLSEEAGVTVHPSICIVNGEATDGTKNAPVLAFGPPPGSQKNLKKASDGGRAGLVDTEVDRALYDRNMGCCIRTTKEIKKDEVIMTVPKPAMVTPDLVASSDAAKAVLACIKAPGNATATNFWDAFENTTICESKFIKKIQRVVGTQMLVKILQERKRAENAYTKASHKLEAMKDDSGKNGANSYKLAQKGSISTRAAFLAFLIHQRFSNNSSPPVASNDPAVVDEFKEAKESMESNALRCAREISKPRGCPSSFAPYARTLPSSISLPLSWQREELALLSGCIPGTGLLQEIAARTLQLASEFIALLEAGILHRFPTTFPHGLITWERWVWAAACVQSRMLPSSCYLNDGDKKASNVPASRADFQSPAHIWDELGVMLPLMDMVNHEVEAHQITWQPCVPSKVKSNGDGNGMDVDVKDGSHPPQAIVHKRVKKGSQVYCCYGSNSNHNLLLQYGFAQLGNLCDDVRIGWSLSDAVGFVQRPSDYEPPFEETGQGSFIYDTSDAEATKGWWTEERLSLLKKEAFNSPNDTFFSQLKNGKKLSANAYSDGTFDPFLLSSAVIATMPIEDVKRNIERSPGERIQLTRNRQRILRNYLIYFFTRKIEKLLQNVYGGLKNHFKPLNLWQKAKLGGLRYSAEEIEGAESQHTGWQSFFEAHAYSATLEAENRYYAMGAESCVLTLFDGQLRSVQASLDGLSSEEKFRQSVLKQLGDLDFQILSEEGDAIQPSKSVKTAESGVKVEPKDKDAPKDDLSATGTHHGQNGKMEVDSEKVKGESLHIRREETQNTDAKNENDDEKEKGKGSRERDGKDQSKQGSDGAQKKKEETKKSPSKSSRRRNKRKNAAANNAANAAAITNHMGDRAPAIKLHIGNLAYSTTQATLYEFFSVMCGRESVLECHIPTERDTGRSRGFGFVTLPEPIARNILKSGKKHEVDGRPLKIAESNSAGSGKGSRMPVPPPISSAERCANCGYRPKYCACRAPNVPGFGPPPPPPPPPHMHPHGPPMDMMEYGGRDYYGGGAGRFRDDRFGHSNSPYNRPRPNDRDRPYGREADRGQWGYHRERSRSRSYGRDDSRMRDRSRRDRRGRERSRSRSRSPRGRRGRDRDSERRWGHRRSSSRSRSRSRSYSSGSSRSRSPHGKRDHDSIGSARKDKKAEVVGGGGKEHNEEVRGTNAATANKPRENRKRSHSRGGGRKKKKSKRRPARSRSRSRSRSPSPRSG